MSTETEPQAPPPAQTTDPTDDVTSRYNAAIAAAEEAKRRYDELAAKATAAPAPALATTPPPTATLPPEVLSEIEAFKAARRREAEATAIAYAKAQGLKPEIAELPREELLKVIPIVDPNTEEGRTTFEAWRNARPKAFEARGPTLAQTRAAYEPRIAALKAKNTSLINPEAALAGRRGGQ